MANNTFSVTGGNKVPRSIFDLSHQVLTTIDMGRLYPVMCLEVVPGDVMSVSQELVVRFNPMVSPVLHEINAYVHTFFVPNRLLWTSWEDFMTGGEDGTEAPTLPEFDPADKNEGTLWDYLGFPTSANVAMATDIEPVAFPAYAYNMIYNEYYRDQTQITEVALGTNTVQKRAWEKDYFTSALPWQQRGTAPALPVTLSGTVEIDPIDRDITLHSDVDATARIVRSEAGTNIHERLGLSSNPSGTGDARWTDPALDVDLSGGTATTFDIADLRLALAQQRMLELNARAGSRYTEWLKANFAVAPRDDRLDRPEYVGGIRAPVVISEVLNTSDTATAAQGEMAGHGITVDNQSVGRFRAQEFGVLMSILSVMPRAVYSEGVDRNWIKSTRYDYYNPLLAHLSEQQVLEGEILSSITGSENTTVFGYQGRFNELRYTKSRYTGKMRAGSTFDHWHIGRRFASRPSLNQTFIECTPDTDFRAAVVTNGTCVVHVGNRVKAARPLPIVADPSLLGS